MRSRQTVIGELAAGAAAVATLAGFGLRMRSVMPYWLPSGERPSRVFRPFMYVGSVAVIIAMVAWALLPWELSDDPAISESGLVNPVGVAGAAALLPVSLGMVAIAALGGLVSLGVRLLRARGVERGQLAWVSAGMLGTLGLLVIAQTVQANGSGVLLAASALPLLPPLSAATEAAALRIVGEALANAARHASAATCDIDVALSPDALHVSVRDDGVGIAAPGPSRRTGVGLESMAEAAAQLDGRCEILVPAGGGTEVRVRLPIALPNAEV